MEQSVISNPQPIPSTRLLPFAQVIGTAGGGGAERLAYNLALGLHQAGKKSFCIALKSGGTYGAGGAVPLLELGLNDVRGWGFLAGAKRLRSFLRQHAIGVLHIHGYGCLQFCIPALFGMCNRPRVWFTWHNSEDVLERERGLKRHYLLWCLRRCERLFGPSTEVIEKLRKVAGKSSPISVFRNGVPEIAPSRHVADDVPTLLWMARFMPTKDPQLLIHAAARLRDSGLKFRLVMAGSPYPVAQGFYDQTHQLICDLDLATIVSLPGWVDDTTALIQSASIGVQTSLQEGLSMSLLEQMMAGLAVVATDVGQTREALESCGLLIPPKDIRALADALRELIVDPEHRQRLGCAARRRALAEFSTQAMVTRTIDMYCTPQPGTSRVAPALPIGSP